MSKINTLDNYLERINKIYTIHDYDEAETLQKEIIAVYSSEIKDLTLNLSTYGLGPIDYIYDLKLLQAKLLNYRDNLEMVEKNVHGPVTNVTVTQNQNNTQCVDLNFDQTITLIDALEKDVLSEEDKDTLKGKLLSIDKTTDKNQRWTKIQNILKWIADKSVEVGIAALPYISSSILKAQ